MTHRTCASLLAAALALLLVGSCSQAAPTPEQYPASTIEVVVPYSEGGGTDILARSLVGAMADHLPNGQSIVVRNVGGASGVIGATEVFNSDPDGYTIGLLPAGTLTLQPHYGDASYDHTGFEHIARITLDPQLLAVRRDAPWQTFDEWLSWVRENGGAFKYGTTGVGGPGHVTGEGLNDVLGIDIENVPYDGASNAAVAVLSGEVDGMFGPYQDIFGYLQDDSMRLLVNAGSAPLEAASDLPWLSRLGHEFVNDSFVGLSAPAGTPPEVLRMLESAVEASVREPAVRDRFVALGLAVNYAGAQEYTEFVAERSDRNRTLLADIGIID